MACGPESRRCSSSGAPEKRATNLVSDETWEAVVPELYRNCVVCLMCFDTLAHARGVSYALDPTLYFVGDQGSLILKLADN